MKRTMLHFWEAGAGAGALLLLTAAAWAAGTTGAEFLQLQTPAGVAALGAGVADARGGESLNWNPAGMFDQPYASLALTHFSGLVDTAYEQVEGYAPDLGWGPWSMRLFYDSTYNFTEVNEAGDSVGTLENYDLMLHVAHAQSLAPGLTAGVGLKFFESALAGFHSRGAAADLGVRYRPGQGFWSAGCVLSNLGSKTAFDQEADVLPLALTAGLACAWRPASGHQFKFLGDVRVPLAGDEAPFPLVGAEYALQDTALVRAGYRWDHELGSLSLGAGLRWSRWGVDYAYQPYGTLGNNHRLTLTYAFKPLPPASPESPAPAPTPEAATVAQAQYQEPKLKTLTAPARAWENVITFQVPAAAVGPKVRTLEIRDSQNRLVKTFAWAPGAPADLHWDNRDEQGRLVSTKEQFAYRWAAEGRTATACALPQVQPVLKLFFTDGTTLEAQADFEFLARPPAKSWSLVIYAKNTGEAVRLLSGQNPLPAALAWDGRTRDLSWAPPQGLYHYRLAITDDFGREVAVQDSIHPVKARRTEAPAGQSGVLIPEILFDFNSAVLKPEALDKIAAAAQILKRHPGQATAVCEGHADEVGGVEFNRAISRQRATMVAAFMIDSLGVPGDALFIRGFGKDRPEDPGSSEEARARNRRVEIRITLPAAP
jgi:outer membrane protein OmpA-like peptidoglycan-associated protein